MLLDVAIIAAVLLTGLVLWAPRVHGSTVWQAMTTPLASIIGSGFLVLGPILDASYGRFAPLAMAALCLAAYCYGFAIRFNIAAIGEDKDDRGRLVSTLETLSSWALGFAYVISVACYLNLFGAFAVSLTEAAGPFSGKVVTTAVFIVILFVGWTRGFKSLEHLEYVSVTLKLAIIAGLLTGLAVYFSGRMFDGGLIFNDASVGGWAAITLGFGLIVTVQGFETSRYLGETYRPDIRIRSMRRAQWLTTLIYMGYILLFSFIFERGEIELSETAIVDMLGIVAPVLPALLVAAALSAQFSAAIADTGGSGGLVFELTSGRISERLAYALLAAAGMAMTWTLNVFEIISYASRAFAVYYAVQALIAALGAARNGQPVRTAFFAMLAMLGSAIAVLGQAVEA
ncbi:MAG: hypothetical protein KDJ80_14955 [Nitratireductor sp.]|nr:hypothetical protein [Nitratireductor sp.]